MKREYHGGSKNNRLYQVWQNMKRRTSGNVKREAENRLWFSKGIRTCEEWRQSFTAFRDWALSHGYDDTKQIDRIEPLAGYNPDNCRFVTHQQNLDNRINYGHFLKQTWDIGDILLIHILWNTMPVGKRLPSITKSLPINKCHAAAIARGKTWPYIKNNWEGILKEPSKYLPPNVVSDFSDRIETLKTQYL